MLVEDIILDPKESALSREKDTGIAQLCRGQVYPLLLGSRHANRQDGPTQPSMYTMNPNSRCVSQQDICIREGRNPYSFRKICKSENLNHFLNILYSRELRFNYSKRFSLQKKHLFSMSFPTDILAYINILKTSVLAN